MIGKADWFQRRKYGGWAITLIALLGIFWLNHFEILRFSVNAVITIVYVIMIATMIFYQKLHWKRGIE
ncbi:MAG: hypothetical protein ACQESG_06940 [Nanobdellota archaeon]